MESAFRFTFIPAPPPLSYCFCSGKQGIKALGGMEILMILRLCLRLSPHDWPCLNDHFRSLRDIASFFWPSSDPGLRFTIILFLLRDVIINITVLSGHWAFFFFNYKISISQGYILKRCRFILNSSLHPKCTHTHLN